MINLRNVTLAHWMQSSYWCIDALSVRLPVSIEHHEAGLVAGSPDPGGACAPVLHKFLLMVCVRNSAKKIRPSAKLLAVIRFSSVA